MRWVHEYLPEENISIIDENSSSYREPWCFSLLLAYLLIKNHFSMEKYIYFEVSLFLNRETIDLESLASQQVIEI